MKSEDLIVDELETDGELLFHDLTWMVSDSIKTRLTMSLSEWASTITIPPGSSSTSGKYRWELAPYQKEILDELGNPENRQVVWRSSSQTGKSLLMILFILSRIQYLPGPTMLAMDSLLSSNAFFDQRIAPLIRANPEILRLMDTTKHSSYDKLGKKFMNGQVFLGGATSPMSLSSKPVRWAVADEVGRWNKSSGKEGNPMSLLRARLLTYNGRELLYMNSTPTVKDYCEITRLYELGTQLCWNHQCQSCGEYYKPVLDRMIYDEEDPTTAKMACEHCGFLHDDLRSKRAMQDGMYIAENPTGEYPSFHTDAFSSPFVGLSYIAQEQENDRGDKELQQVFENTMLGLPFDRDLFNRENVAKIVLNEYLEPYSADRMPTAGRLLVCAVDVQDTWLSAIAYCFADKYTSYYVTRAEFQGNTDMATPWDALAKWFSELRCVRTDGIVLRPSCMVMDSGGHRTTTVYQISEKYSRWNWYAIKGKNQTDAGLPIVSDRPKGVGKHQKGKFWSVCSDVCKLRTYEMISAMQTVDGVMGRYHFPEDLKDPDGFWKELISESYELDKNGNARFTLPDHMRNEMLDITAYCHAGVEIMGTDFEKLEKQLQKNKRSPERLAAIKEATEKDKTITSSDQQSEVEKLKPSPQEQRLIKRLIGGNKQGITAPKIW